MLMLSYVKFIMSVIAWIVEKLHWKPYCEELKHYICSKIGLIVDILVFQEF